MFETSELIYTILNGNAALMALITKVSPLSSNQKTDMPFINFTISEQQPISKGLGFEYGLSINCFSEEYDNTLKIADAVKVALGESQPIRFKYSGSTPDVQNGIIITTSNYSFKN